MNMSDIIGPQQVLAKVRASDKAQLLHELARRAAQALGLDIRAILDPLLAREQLGSTGVGSGIALPHAKVTGLDRLYGLFARLERPIDFASVDERPVDLVFLLLTPPAATPSISRRSPRCPAACASALSRPRSAMPAPQIRSTAPSSAAFPSHKADRIWSGRRAPERMRPKFHPHRRRRRGWRCRFITCARAVPQIVGGFLKTRPKCCLSAS
jgi:nitrogen PTS system EIIA component